MHDQLMLPYGRTTGMLAVTYNKKNMLENEVLLIPDKEDEERNDLANTWKYLGGEVKRIGKFWIKPEVGNKRVSLYGFDTFCLVLAGLKSLSAKLLVKGTCL